MFEFKLPEDFLLGTATSSVQIEGGDTNNTWYKWCTEGHTKDSSSCVIATDHWNRVDEDIQILKKLNVQVHRMSLEWSRIEPAKGVFSEEALNHYKYEIEQLQKNNIKPLVTLHHFSDPLWFHNMGAWENPECTKIFLEYVGYVVERLGHLVGEWITFNEPNVYTILGYGAGLWPPGKKNIFKYFRVQAILQKTHIEAYKLIHCIRKNKGYEGKTLVSCALHVRIFEGKSFAGKMLASLANYIFNDLYFDGIIKGNHKFPLHKLGYKKDTYVDFLAVNYYTKILVEFSLRPSTAFYKEGNDESLDQTELGWDIYPMGIYEICKKYYKRYNLPIFITENGISDKADTQRPHFIVSHLENLAKAISEGIPVKRYYHWTLIDNFEWLEGETTHFGLVECDFNTLERASRKSALLYSKICKNKKFTRDMIDSIG